MAQRGMRGLYDTCHEIGKGAFGEVYLVKDRQGTKLAMKRIKTWHLHSAKERQLVANEAALLKSLKHPFIVECIDVFKDPQPQNGVLLCIVMSLAEGGDLKDKIKRYIRRGKFIEERQVWSLAAQVAHAVAYLHMQHIM